MSSNWIIDIDSEKCNQGHENNEKGVFIGNGKIGLFTDFIGCGHQKCMIAGDFKMDLGIYKSNTIETFYTSKWKPFNPSLDVNTKPISQSLNMRTGIFTSNTEYTNLANMEKINISCDTYVSRQLPYCVVQTLRITSETETEFLLFQDVSGTENMHSIDYSFSVIDMDTLSNVSKPMSLLSGRAYDNETQVCFASCIIFDDEQNDNQLLGFNRYVNDNKKCYVKMNIKCKPNIVTRIHCFTVHMTSFDFDKPYDESKMVILSILNKPLYLNSNITQKVRQDHIIQWSKLWDFDIVLNVAENSTSDINENVQTKLRKDLYMIFSCIRDGVQLELNPNLFGVIDTTNVSIYDGDLFLVPLLLFALPGAAKSLLEFRYKQLTTAISLAASYGYSGAKFPYNNDVLGYRNALYWDSLSPLYLFNNAVIAVNVWNYYRCTLDREWLSNKGFSILKACAEFFVSKSTYDKATNMYNLEDVVAFNSVDQPSNNNSFTNNLVKLALKAVVEASYELGFAPNHKWYDMMETLPVNIATTGLDTYEVVLYDGSSTADNVVNDSYHIIEPLFNMTPMLSELYFVPGSRRGFDSLQRNFEFYKSRIETLFVNHPLNTAIILSVYGILNKYNNSYVDDFLNYLNDNYVKTNTTVWGLENNVSLASFLPLVFINSIAGVRVQGGVSDMKFYYEEMGIKAIYASNFPTDWESVIVTNCGPAKKTFTIFNQNIL